MTYLKTGLCVVTSLVLLLLLYPCKVPLLLGHVNWQCVAKPVKEKSLLDEIGHIGRNVCFICWTTGTSVFTNTSHIYLACTNWLYNGLAQIEFHSFKKKKKKKGNVFTKEKIKLQNKWSEMKEPIDIEKGAASCWL